MKWWRTWRMTGRPSRLCYCVAFLPGTRLTSSGRMAPARRMIGMPFFVERP